MAMANKRVRFFVLAKSSALERVANKRKLSVDEILKDGIPESGQFYLYARVKSLDGAAIQTPDGQRRLRCFFDELDLELDMPTGRRGVLNLCGRSLTDIVHCISLPANFLLCNFQLASDMVSGAERINLFDIELEMDDERTEDGEIYKIEEEQRKSRLPLDSEYTELKKVVEAQKLSVYGVIKNIVVLGNGNLKLYLTDPSLDFENHIICFLASRFAEMLPRQAKVGDVLRLHRISARYQHGAMQLFGCMEKFGLSWLLFDGTPGSDLTPISSSLNFTFSEKDKDVARCMRSWFFNIRKSRPVDITDRPLVSGGVTQLKHFALKSYGNLLLQVIGVFESVRSSRPIVIRGWDGTKCSTPSIQVNPEKEQMPILSYNKDLSELVNECAVDVFVYDHHRDTARYIVAGQYVLLTNVHFGFLKPPDYAFSLHGGQKGEIYGRGIKELDETDPRITDVKSRIEHFNGKLPREQFSKLKEVRLIMDGIFNDEANAPAENQRRALSVPPEFRQKDAVPQGRPGSSSPPRYGNANDAVQNRAEPPPVPASSNPATPSRPKRAQPPKSSSTATNVAVRSPRSSDDRAASSPTPSVSSLVDQLRRPPLAHSSQHQVTTTTRISSSRILPSANKASETTAPLDSSIYSQESPIRIHRTKTAPRPEMVSVSIETTQNLTVVERQRPSVRPVIGERVITPNPRQGASTPTPTGRSKMAKVATPTSGDKRPRRATAVKKYFFEEDVSDLSSSSSEESNSEYSDSDEEEVQRRRLHLRNRTVDVQVTPQRSPKTAKVRSPHTKNRTPRAKRGRK